MFRAEIEATNYCNTRCLHCPHEAITRPKGRMTWATFSAIAAKIRAHSRGERFALSFSGMGEPLLNPQLCHFIQHVSAEAETSFASNGALLTEENIARLIDAGLDAIYLSYNGDEPELFAKMMGGISEKKVWEQARRAVELARNSRLKIRANISVTKTNQHRLSQIRSKLEDAGIGPIAISMCHNRGGNLRDPAVCKTPPMGEEKWTCDVLENTLFIDWRGRAFICDHDIHGEHGLGDLLSEPLATVLARRQRLIEEGVSFAICQGCNDVMRVGNAAPLASGAGGIFRDWIFALYKDEQGLLPAATPPFRWIFRIFEQEGRLDRMVNRLLEIEAELQRTLAREHEENLALHDRLAAQENTNEGLRIRLEAAERDLQTTTNRLEERESDNVLLRERLLAQERLTADLARQLRELRSARSFRAWQAFLRRYAWIARRGEFLPTERGVVL